MKPFQIPESFDTITFFTDGPDPRQPVSFYCDYSGSPTKRNFTFNSFSWAAIIVQGEQEWPLGGLLKAEKATQSLGEGQAIIATYQWLKSHGCQQISGFSDSPHFFEHIRKHLKDRNLQLNQVSGTHPTHKKAHNLCKKIKKEYHQLKNSTLAINEKTTAKPTYFIDVIFKEGCWAATIHHGECAGEYMPLHSTFAYNFHSFTEWLNNHPQATLISSDAETLENCRILSIPILRGTENISHNLRTKATFKALQEARAKEIKKHDILPLEHQLNKEDFTEQDWLRLERYFEDLKKFKSQIHQQQQTIRGISLHEPLRHINHDLKTFFTTTKQAHILISALKESEKHNPTARYRLSNFISQKYLTRQPITTHLKTHKSGVLHTLYQQKNLKLSQLSENSELDQQALKLLIHELHAYGVINVLPIWPDDMHIHFIGQTKANLTASDPPATPFQIRGHV